LQQFDEHGYPLQYTITKKALHAQEATGRVGARSSTAIMQQVRVACAHFMFASNRFTVH
jgi:hypothetical protein